MIQDSTTKLARASNRILVVAEEAAFVTSVQRVLQDHSWDVEHVPATEAEVDDVAQLNCLAIIVRYDEGTSDRSEIIAAVATESFTPVIAVVPKGDVGRTVEAMKSGAETVLEQGPNIEPLLEALVDVLEFLLPQAMLALSDPRDAMIRHRRSPLNGLLVALPQIARSNSPVLITGESGTGKELFARIIHEMSDRRDGPFIPVNCGAIAETLLESELFGHVAGAFTGATHNKIGQFEAANRGTIFLDEIASMPVHLQVKILRVLQEKQVHPVGSNKPVKIDFRVVAASNVNIEEQIESGGFRQDLYYRLGVFPIHLPALRQRPMDIPVLADRFIEEMNQVHGTCMEKLTPEIRSLLKQYTWPGNVRELHNVIQRVCVLKQVGFIDESDLPPPILECDPFRHMGLDVPSEGMDIAKTLDMLEDRLLTQALVKASGNKALAARLLGLNRTTLVEKLKRKRIEVDSD